MDIDVSVFEVLIAFFLGFLISLLVLAIKRLIKYCSEQKEEEKVIPNNSFKENKIYPEFDSETGLEPPSYKDPVDVFSNNLIEENETQKVPPKSPGPSRKRHNLAEESASPKRICIDERDKDEEYSEELNFFLYTETPTKSFFRKEISEEDLISEEVFCPPEGHCIATEIVGNCLKLYVFGGSWPESRAKSTKSNVIYVAKYIMDDKGIIFQQKEDDEKASTQTYLTCKFWLKNQLKDSMDGSYIPPLTYSSMCFVDERLYLFMGYEW